MAIDNNTSNRLLLALFTIASYLLFGFILWKPEVWARMTPFKPCSPQLLTKFYRYLSVAVLIGVTLHVLVIVK